MAVKSLLKSRPGWQAEDVREPTVPMIPDNLRVYAVGDIHGRLDLLKTLHEAIDEDAELHPGPQCIEVYLGDYVDRGSQSAGVIDALMERVRTRNAVCLAGNHEAIMLDALTSQEAFASWLRMGGVETVFSYVQPSGTPDQSQLWTEWRAGMRLDHVDFLRQLPTSYVCGDYLFVHAGLRPGVSLAAQDRNDLLWIRREFLDYPHSFGHLVVHGHTPIPTAEVLSNRINIDTGAYATGHLTCLVLEGVDRFLIST